SELPPAALELAGKLFDLAREGSTDALGQYLDAGIPLNLTNSKGDTLLMLAAYHGHVETTRLLLQKGADPNVLNDRGQSILAGAVFKGHDEVVRILFEGMDGRKADVRLGQPNAVDSASMFQKEDYLRLFGVESG
ncbi:ankyrin repeat-containing domain protein, partial [Elsinoe ampelina]